MSQTRLIDLSHPLEDATPVWPGNPPTQLDILRSIPAEFGPGQRTADTGTKSCNVSAFRTCNHTGTHMDAPTHFYNGLPTIDRVPLDQCIGPATLIDVNGKSPREEITPADLAPREASIVAARKVVLHTGWSSRWGRPEYFHDYPVLGESAAEWLIARGVHLVGLDAPSVDRDPNPAHYVLLGGKSVIVENLTRLDQIGRDVFELIVLPLPLRGLEGSPVRAVARVSG